MGNWNNLPSEVLENILQSLYPLYDVRQCALICRSWVSPAQHIIFRDINLSNKERVENLNNIFSFHQSGSYSSSYKQCPTYFVKKIDLFVVMSIILNIEEWDVMFPFVEIINISKYCHQLHYDQLYKLMVKGKFPNLKKIPFITWNKNHMELVLTRKEHITMLVIQDDPYVDKKLHKIFQELHLFHNLIVLQLHCSNRKTNVCLEKLLSKGSSTLQVMDIKFDPCSSLKLDTSLSEIVNVHPLSSVKRITIESDLLLSGGDNCFTYITKKFPNVQDLYLSCEWSSQFKARQYSTLTAANLTPFLIFLFNIKTKSKALPIITDGLTTEVITNFCDYVSAQNLGNNKQVKIYLTIAINVKNWLWGDNFYDDNRTAFINMRNYYVKDNPNNEKHCELEVNYKSSRRQPFFELFENLGNYEIDTLTLDDSVKFVSLYYDVLEIFTTLKNLHLKGLNSIEIWSEEETYQKSALESLYFERCQLFENIFPEISECCPNLKVLELCVCTFQKKVKERNMPLDIDKTVISINMPNSRLQVLTLMMLPEVRVDNRLGISNRNFRKGFIRLITADNKKPRYCEITFKTPFSIVEVSTKDCYDTCIKEEKEDYVFYDIYCESVGILVVDGKEDEHIP